MTNGQRRANQQKSYQLLRVFQRNGVRVLVINA